MAVIEEMNLQSDFISPFLQIVAGSGGLRSGNTIFLAERSSWSRLGDHGCLEKRVVLLEE